MRLAPTILAALTLFAGNATAQPAPADPPDLPRAGATPDGVPPDAPEPTIADPDWLRRPSSESMTSFYPPQASGLGMSGNATMFCSVLADGHLTDCRVIGEFPRNMGFGRAALRMSRDFQMGPQRGSPPGASIAGATVRIPIRFVMPGGLPPLTAFAVCYNIAAREAEAHPQDQAVRDAYMAWRMSYSYLLSQSYASAEEIEQRLVTDRTTEGVEILRTAFDDPSAHIGNPLDAFGRMRRLCSRATPNPRPRATPSNAAPAAQH